jgi:ATP-binding cassette subfamily F protein uup
MDMKLFECVSLSKDYDGNAVFEGLSLSIEEGDRIALVGPNGTGKSSLLAIIGGLNADYRGAASWHKGIRRGILLQRAEHRPGESAMQHLLRDARAAEFALRRLEL